MSGGAPATGSNAARAALARHCAGLLADDALLDDAELLGGDEVPAPFDRLLVHRDHMTSTLGTFYGAAVELRVLSEHRAGDDYVRKILLELPDNGPVVEFGIARIYLAQMPPPVRDEILARRCPLGDILIRHDLMRTIDPRWFWRFPVRGELAAAFRAEGGGPACGRFGSIRVNGAVAIEVLEIVIDARRGTGPVERSES